MHIIYFHQHFSTPQGSAGTRSYEMAQALVRAGHRVTMVCGTYAQGNTGLSGTFRNGQRSGYVDKIKVIEFDLRYANSMGFLARSRVFLMFAIRSVALVFRKRADIVFATTTPLTAGLPGIAARWLTRKLFVFEVRDLWPELPRAMGVISNPIILWMMAILEWASYHSANRLIGLSPGIVEGIAAKGVKKSLIKMVPNGCDLELFSAGAQPWRPPGVRDDQLLAIYTGTHGNANGLDSILNAAEILMQLGRSEILIALFGQGLEKPRLQSKCKERGLDNVLFFDPIPKSKIASLMAGADLGLQVLRDVPEFYYGTSPNKFFDYISAGLPVLNNYPGWVANLVEEFDCGFTVPANEPRAFAEALIQAAENRYLLEKKGSNARMLARNQFSREELSDSWVRWVTASPASR